MKESRKWDKLEVFTLFSWINLIISPVSVWKSPFFDKVVMNNDESSDTCTYTYLRYSLTKALVSTSGENVKKSNKYNYKLLLLHIPLK